MKKGLISLAFGIALLSVISVTGCQKERSRDSGITTLNLFAGLSVGEPGYKILIEKVALFEQEHPNTKIVIDLVDHDSYHVKLQALAAGGQLPDLLWIWPGKRTGYVTERGLIKDLRPFIERDGVADKFLPIITESQGSYGEVYQIGGDLTTTAIVYTNRRLLDELGLNYPETLSEWIDQADFIKAKGYKPLSVGNRSSWVLQSSLLSLLTAKTGGVEWFLNARSGREGASFLDSPFIEAIDWIKRMSEGGLLTQGVNSVSREQAIANFINENSVYYLEGSWRAADLAGQLTELQKEYIEFNYVPSIPAERVGYQATSGVPGSGFGINAALEGDMLETAWQFVLFYSGGGRPDINIKYGHIPALRELDGLVDDLDPMLKKLIAFNQDAEITYVIDDKMDAGGVNIVNSGIQELILGSKTAKQLANEFELWVAANDTARK